MRHIIAWIALVLTLVGASVHAATPTQAAGSPAAAETNGQIALPPRPDGPVLDQANVIPADQKAALDARLRAYNKATGRAVIVATIGSLDGLPVEDYAQRLAETWGIGGKDTREGVLLLIAPNERKLRIHTSGEESDRMTDALSGRIIRDVIAPKFRAGDFGGGIAAGVDAIIAQLDRSPADAKAVAEAAATARQNAGADDGASIPSVLFWIGLIVFFTFMFGGWRGRGGRRRSGIDPGIVLWGASEAARHFGGRDGGGFGGGGFGGGGDGGGFGGFGGGGGGFDGGGASGDW